MMRRLAGYRPAIADSLYYDAIRQAVARLGPDFLRSEVGTPLTSLSNARFKTRFLSELS